MLFRNSVNEGICARLMVLVSSRQRGPALKVVRKSKTAMNPVPASATPVSQKVPRIFCDSILTATGWSAAISISPPLDCWTVRRGRLQVFVRGQELSQAFACAIGVGHQAHRR